MNHDKEFHYQLLILFAVIGLAICVVGFAKAINVGKVPTTSASASLSAETVGKLPRVVKNLDEKGCEK